MYFTSIFTFFYYFIKFFVFFQFSNWRDNASSRNHCFFNIPCFNGLI